GVRLAGSAIAVAAIFAAPERHALGIDVRCARSRDRCRERVIAEALRRLAEHARAEPRLDRLVGILIAARPPEGNPAGDDLSIEIARLPGHAAELVEAIVERLDLFVTYRPILDRHVARDGVGAVAFGDRTANAEVARQVAPMERAPVAAGAAHALA